MEQVDLDPGALLELARYKMPFGRFAGRYLKDIPEEYLFWLLRREALSKELLENVQAMLAIKENGFERLLDPLCPRDAPPAPGRPTVGLRPE